jgi:DNA-directed RNA polymerase subunit RPC12/RpoP
MAQRPNRPVWPAMVTRDEPTTQLDCADEPSAEERAAQRRAARIRFRACCIACGRATESADPEVRPGRCAHCGGTILVEPTVG